MWKLYSVLIFKGINNELRYFFFIYVDVYIVEWYVNNKGIF